MMAASENVTGSGSGDFEIDGFDLDAGAAMDRADLRLLTDLLAIYDVVDPMPEMLPEVVLFGLDATNLDAEFARLVESELAVSGASGTRSVNTHGE